MPAPLLRRCGVADRPNILLIVTDEERANIPLPDGYALPSRERLAATGVTFRNYYAASVQCSSARSVMYTGRHVPITQIFDNDNMPYVRPLDPALGTIGTMLGSAGYYCTYQGKWHLSNAYVDASNPSPTTRALEPYGFYEWNDWGDIDGGAWAGLRVDPVVAGQAAKWLRDRAAVVEEAQPWFMAVNFVNPHDIMSFDYGGQPGVALPPVLAHAVKIKPPAAIPLYTQTWEIELPPTIDDDLAGAAPAVRDYAAMLDTVFGTVDSDEAWRAGLTFYLNCIRDVDRHIGVVLDALEASGQADRTAVIFTADHGELAGSHGLRQKGNVVYDENFHVPLIVDHPDSRAGGSTDALASAVDLAPTILEMAGVASAAVTERFPDLKGHSLMRALDGQPVREGVLTAVESVLTLDAGFWKEFSDPDVAQRLQSGELRPDWTKRGFMRGYTDGRHTFARYFSPLEPNRPSTVDALFEGNDVVLYDRDVDGGETENLAADPHHRDVVARYHAKLEALIDAEVGTDTHAWVADADRPQLLGWPTWRGDTAA
jgi:arylsulfatase